MTRPDGPPPRPSWGPTPGPTAPVPRWARSDPRTAVGRGRLLLAGLLAVGLLAGSAAAVWLGLWFHPPRPVAVVLVAAGYETNLVVPHNVYGRRGAERLAGLRAADGWAAFGPPTPFRIGSRWDHDLDAATAPAVMVYFAVHGGADDRGAYLLPDDTDGRDTPDQKLRLIDVIDRLARLPADRVKFLLLDATGFESAVALGMPRNEFARALADLEPRIAAVPNLVVFSSSGPDQRSWFSPEYGDTVFGWAVRKALDGDAADPDGDGVLNFDEAFAGAASRVTEWARQNRAALQTPVLLPSGAEGRRRAAAVTVGRVASVPDPPPPPPLADLPPDVAAAWTDAAALRAWQPAPYVYSPHLWRRYLATLLRYEELQLAGERLPADRMRDALRQLARTLDGERKLTLDSAHNALPMAAVAGLTADPSAARAADELWAGPAADATATWAARIAPAAANPDAATAFRLAVMTRLFDLEGTAPDPRLERLNRLLALVEDPSRPRPAESQFARVLYRDLPAAVSPADLLRHSFVVRLRAERAALGSDDPPPPTSYGERVVPFTKAIVDSADADRWPAQDRLLATDEASWVAARTGLDKAAAGYDRALVVNAAARRVLTARNRVAAELPFYVKWLADAARPDDPADWRAFHDSVANVEAMWAEWHALGRAFTAAEATADPAAAVGPLADRADRLNGDLDKLAAGFAAPVAALAGVDLPSVWRQAAVALDVPFLDVDARRRLIANVRRTSWMFLTESRPGPAEPPSTKATAERSDDRARRQGRLALSALGEVWFDRPAGGEEVPGWESSAVVAHRLTTFAADPDGWKSLLRAGTEIGRRFQRMPDDIADRLARGGRADLLAADELARMIPPGPGLRVAANPAVRCRLHCLGELFVRQTRRTWAEHFYAFDRNDEPYYRRAGRLYLADAPAAAGAADVRKQLEAPGGLRLVAAPDPLGRAGPFALTSEQTAVIPNRLEPEPGAVLPPGVAVWEAVPDAGLELLDGGPRGRTAAALSDKPVSLDPLVRNLVLAKAEADPPASPAGVPIRLTLRAWFRGQRIELDRPVVAYPRPAVAVEHLPRPTDASLAVRAGPDVLRRFGTGTGGVAFVLDCSGSMGAAPGTDFTPETKYAQAVKALEHVLQAVPAGTRVSVRVFGQAVGAERTAAKPEETIETVLPPTAWKPADPGQLSGLMGRVRYPAMTPWNESPILRAMSSAKTDLKHDPGFKTVVVLTDGKDNRFDKDKTLNPDRKDFPTLLNSLFQGTGITVHVVGFKVVPAELDEVRKQFAGLAKLDPPGSFTAADHIDELIAALRRALRQELRYRVETEDRLPVASLDEAGLRVGTGPGGDRWLAPGLTPGGYRVRAADDARSDTDVVLGPGDRLLLGLTGDRERLRFRRLLAADDLPGRPARDRSGWRLSVPQFQRLGAGVQGLVFFEKEFDPREESLQELRPRDVWFELSTAGDVAVTWRGVPGYAAPAWGFDAPTWPGPPAKQTLKAWWNPDQEAVVAGRLDRGADFDKVTDVTDRRLTVDDEEVVVRSVTVEDHVVTTAAGKREPRKCLVVRMAHGPGNPVRVRVRGPAVVGSAQWYYPAAGESTGVFWPAEPDRVRGIEVVWLRAFRRVAEQRGFALTLDDLPAPDPADERPRPSLP